MKDLRYVAVFASEAPSEGDWRMEVTVGKPHYVDAHHVQIAMSEEIVPYGGLHDVTLAQLRPAEARRLAGRLLTMARTCEELDRADEELERRWDEQDARNARREDAAE